VIAAGFALLGEALLYGRAPGAGLWAMGLRALLVAAAAALHHGLTRVEIARVRAHAEKLLDEERARQKEAARSFRLIAAPSPAPHASPAEDDRRVRSSLEEIRETLVGLLALTRRALGLKTCAVFWLDPRGQALRLVEVVTDDEDGIATQPIPVGAGAVGGACAMGKPIVLSKLRPDYGGLGYYAGPHGVRAFAAVPILEDGNVRGVLVGDRAEDRPFDAAEQETLALVSGQTLRHVHNERVFGMLEKSKDELAKLFAASRALGEALTEDQVIAAVVASARAVVEHDVVVLTTYDEKTREHRVRHAEGAAVEKLAGLHFQDNNGIASAAVKTRHALPYRGHFDDRTQYVFTRGASFEGHESVLCLPLVVRDHAIGTLTLAARRRGAFPDATRQLLGVLAAHAAVAMANAAAVRRLEELATTDPMTGLLNKRALEAEFERKIRSAARFGKKLSVLVTDVDKFKSVNDTYGHAVGDMVIKGLGAILAKCKRETDVVARFGGEEFVIVCEETDVEGAYQLAERIRTELGKTVFATEMGPLSVTCSLGVAEFPGDGQNKDELFHRADEALYEAKRGGRNQTCIAGRRAAPVVGAPKKTAAGAGSRQPARPARVAG
jgi:diguanylate cyclase (GGDEF)-like protein